MSERKIIGDNEWETSLTSSGSNSLGSFAVNASVTSRVRHRARYNTHCVHFRLLINGHQKWYSNHTFVRDSYYRFTTGLQTEIVNKAAAAQTVSIVVQVAETLYEHEPSSWDELASTTITVPALSTSHYDFYNDEAMTDLYERIDVYEAQYLTVPSAIPSVAMSEWVDSNDVTYQFGAQVQNTSMQELTHRFSPVFRTPDIKAKVKVSGEWVDGDIKCKVNGEWVDADKVYVKVGGEWVEIS